MYIKAVNLLFYILKNDKSYIQRCIFSFVLPNTLRESLYKTVSTLNTRIVYFSSKKKAVGKKFASSLPYYS